MTHKSFELVRLDPERVEFSRRGDTLSMRIDGREYPRVVLRSCFPVSDDVQFLSVRDASEEEQPEIGIVENVTLLDESSRQAVAAEMSLHYFVPQVLRIHSIRNEFGFLYWSVDTDKGPKEFVMRDSVVHYAREVAPGRWLLIDVNQARYEIPDVLALDSRSKKLVIRHLKL